MRISIWRMIRAILNEESYIWIDVLFIRETEKAILIMFDGSKVWIPKAWIVDAKKANKETMKIKISEYHWALKFDSFL